MTNIAPLVGIIFSIFVAAFLGGTLTAHFKVFPYRNLVDAVRTLEALIDQASGEETYTGKYIEPTVFPSGDAVKSRWTILDTSVPRLPVIATGGLNQYLELCPEHGCLAVTFDTSGDVTRAWPYKPMDIYAANTTDDYPHEMLSFNPLTNTYPIGVLDYGDGDILVNFQSRGDIFPFAMGISRVGQDGAPVWTRFDYSHHWSTLREDGVAYVPGLKVGKENLRFTIGSEPSPKRFTLRCRTERPQLDSIQMIDKSGSVLDEIELIPIFVESNWVGLLPETTKSCDPLHLNYIDVIGANAGPGLTEGDLVISLRNMSAFAIFDPENRKIKRVVSGGFIQQHSVHHLADSRFLIFDNRGGDSLGPASRIVELDLASGIERRIFPNANTPEQYAEVYSDRAGFLDISPDRSRVLASFTHAGRAFEVDIASGRLLAVYDNIHDLSSLEELPEDKKKSAARFSIYGMSYIK